MKKPNAVLRILCGILDAVIVMLPVQFVMMGVFQVSIGQADLLYKFLFAVYGALFTEYTGGTIGKYFGKLCCADVSGEKAEMLYVGLRELVKSLYFIPVIGWTAAGISLLMMIVRKDGRALHDYVGNTAVVFRCKEEKDHGNQ